LPFYAILRAIPNKLGGVVGMLAAILVFLFLPLISLFVLKTDIFRYRGNKYSKYLFITKTSRFNPNRKVIF